MRYLLALWIALVAGSALAHESHVTFARIDVDERTVALELLVAGIDIEEVLDRTLTIPGGIVNPHWLKDAEDAARDYVRPRLSVGNRAGTACTADTMTFTAKHQSVEIVTRWDCADVAGELVYVNRLFFDVAAETRHLTRIGTDPKTQPLTLTVTAPEASLTGPPALRDVLLRYTASGIEHIFIGIDHIAFLVALILWADTFLGLLAVVTAFTLAHSVTLSLAVLGIVTLPATPVEIAIAATIVYAAGENFFRRTVRGKWRVAFVLGLVHGFGFASVLQAFGLPRDAVAWALAAFNVGVEIGQVAIVAVQMPVLLVADRLLAGTSGAARRSPALVFSVSAVVAAMGLYWLIERTLTIL